jgi:hypothetical protein
MQEQIEGIIGIAVGGFVAAAIVPLSLQMIATANLTGVNSVIATLFTMLLSVMIVVSTILYFLPKVKGK